MQFVILSPGTESKDPVKLLSCESQSHPNCMKVEHAVFLFKFNRIFKRRGQSNTHIPLFVNRPSMSHIKSEAVIRSRRYLNSAMIPIYNTRLFLFHLSLDNGETE